MLPRIIAVIVFVVTLYLWPGFWLDVRQWSLLSVMGVVVLVAWLGKDSE